MKLKVVALSLLCVAQTVGSSFQWDPNTVTYNNMKKLVAAGAVVATAGGIGYNRHSFGFYLSKMHTFFKNLGERFGLLKGNNNSEKRLLPEEKAYLGNLEIMIKKYCNEKFDVDMPYPIDPSSIAVVVEKIKSTYEAINGRLKKEKKNILDCPEIINMLYAFVGLNAVAIIQKNSVDKLVLNGLDVMISHLAGRSTLQKNNADYLIFTNFNLRMPLDVVYKYRLSPLVEGIQEAVVSDKFQKDFKADYSVIDHLSGTINYAKVKPIFEELTKDFITKKGKINDNDWNFLFGFQPSFSQYADNPAYKQYFDLSNYKDKFRYLLLPRTEAFVDDSVSTTMRALLSEYFWINLVGLSGYFELLELALHKKGYNFSLEECLQANQASQADKDLLKLYYSYKGAESIINKESN